MSSGNTQNNTTPYKNPLETNLGSGSNAALERILRQYRQEKGYQAPEAPAPRVESNIFNQQAHYENNEKPHEIAQLLHTIRTELADLQTQNASLAQEAIQIQSEIINYNQKEQTSKYHVTFLEFILDMVRGMRVKVSQAHAWARKIRGRSAQRDSYMGRASRLGTSYTQSQELQVARSAN
ncbi:MAG: hypothetical protein UZ21_OP11001000695 [Microgenomates bacterium OLB22]|nr:MAG: hypothetical protein UZ21_OP11001000695 [Microgenomates bacterium OLB22]